MKWYVVNSQYWVVATMSDSKNCLSHNPPHTAKRDGCLTLLRLSQLQLNDIM